MQVILITILITIVNSIQQYQKNYLSNLTEENQKVKKFNLLSEYVALVWGYRNFENYTAQSYLEELADFLLKDYDLTLQQKVRSIKVRHILETYHRRISYHQHVMAAYELAMLKNISGLSLMLEKQYIDQKHYVGDYILSEEELAIELLMQSFAPSNLTQEHSPNPILDTIFGLRKSMQTTSIGTYNLVNELLDPEYRLNAPEAFVLNDSPTTIRINLQEQAGKNFEVYKKPLQKHEEKEFESLDLEIVKVRSAVVSCVNVILSKYKSPNHRFIQKAEPHIQADNGNKTTLSESSNTDSSPKVKSSVRKAIRSAEGDNKIALGESSLTAESVPQSKKIDKMEPLRTGKGVRVESPLQNQDFTQSKSSSRVLGVVPHYLDTPNVRMNSYDDELNKPEIRAEFSEHSKNKKQYVYLGGPPEYDTETGVKLHHLADSYKLSNNPKHKQSPNLESLEPTQIIASATTSNVALSQPTSSSESTSSESANTGISSGSTHKPPLRRSDLMYNTFHDPDVNIKVYMGKDLHALQPMWGNTRRRRHSQTNFKP